MKLLRLLLPICALALLLPAQAAAAPPVQTFGCDLAASLPQAVRAWPVAALLNFKWIQEVAVPLDRVTLNLRVCASSDDSVPAARALSLLVDALPRLQRHAGPALGNSISRQIMFVSAAEMPAPVDGMVDQRGVIVLKPESFDWTVVHEGAHYWANEQHFRDWWMVEGYAEYLTELVMIDFGNPERARRPASACAQVALLEWTNQPLDPYACGYSVGAAIFRELGQAAGQEQLQSTLNSLSSGGRQVDSYSLLVALERATGQDLLPIMQHRVFPASWDAALEHRRELRKQLAAAQQLAGSLQLELPDYLDTAIDDLRSSTADAWLSQLVPLLGTAGALDQDCRRLALDCLRFWQPLPVNAADLAPLIERLQPARSLLDQYDALQRSARALGIALPNQLAREVATLLPDRIDAVRNAARILNDGRALEERCKMLDAPCDTGWRARWSGYDLAGADSQIAAIKALLNDASAVEQSCAGIIAACHAIWHPALQQGHIQDAYAALDQLKQLFSHTRLIEQQCTNLELGGACHTVWAGAFSADQLAGANQSLGDIDVLLQQANGLEQQCRQAGWPCDQTWRAAFRASGNLATTRAAIADMTKALPILSQAAQIAGPPLARVADPPDQRIVTQDEPLIAARAALASGDIASARDLAQQVIDARDAAALRARLLPLILSAMIVLLACVGLAWIIRRGWKRRPKRRLVSNNDLLATLLAEPPGSRPKRSS